jgi:hypothetical protein
MWETIGIWLNRRSSPIAVLFFILGAILIVIEAVEIRLPDGTHVLRVSEFSIFVLALGIVLVVGSGLFQIFDKPTAQEKKNVETDVLEGKKFSTIREILHAYVSLEGGLDFAACMYKGALYHDIADGQLSQRLLHYRMHRNQKEQLEYFLSLSKEVSALAEAADSRLRALDQGILFRVAYDVEKGGLFYTHISNDCYVISATLDQASMDDNTADVEMRSLVKAIESHIARLENQ